jgi:hypothetical protein
MAFIDNSADVILDMVITDAGRQRLARGDGSFKIVKFALAVDYGQYNKYHGSGSAYFDLTILQTPIFEAFTNNTSFMSSKLFSITRNDLLYLPVIKNSPTLGPGGGTYGSAGYYICTTNNDTITSLGVGTGIIDGQTVETSQRNPIVTEQGLDTSEISPKIKLDSDLKETQYIVKLDSRLCEIVVPSGTPKTADISFIDDDKIALYYFSFSSNPEFIQDITNTEGNSAIAGPRGSMFKFSLKSTFNLNTNTYLFTTLGGTVTINTTNYYYIDSTVRIEGVTTGYRLDIPVRFLRKV